MTIFNEDYKEEIFQWLQFEDRQAVPMDMLSGVIYDQTIQNDDSGFRFLRDEAIYRVNARVLAKELPSFTETKTEVLNTPKNPWQFFKDMYADTWFMRWIVKKWPVKYVKQKITLTATWDQWAVYPWLDKVPVSPRWQPVRIPFPAKVDVTKEPLSEPEKSESRASEESSKS